MLSFYSGSPGFSFLFFFLVRKFQIFTFLSVSFVTSNQNIQDSFSICYVKTPDRPDIANTELIPYTVICICKHPYVHACSTTLTVQWWNEEVRREQDGEYSSNIKEAAFVVNTCREGAESSFL